MSALYPVAYATFNTLLVCLLTLLRWLGLLRYGNPWILQPMGWTLIVTVDRLGWTVGISLESLDREKWFPEESP